MKRWSWLLLLAAALPLLAKEKKPAGEVADPRAFAAVRSYCVDTRGLGDDERYEVEGFVAQESKPKKLLTQLPWKLFADCREGDPDVVIKIEFQRLNVTEIQLGDQERNPADAAPGDVYDVKAVLRVSDAGSRQVIYQNQGRPLENSSSESPHISTGSRRELRQSALYHAFWGLVDDARLLSPAGGKSSPP